VVVDLFNKAWEPFYDYITNGELWINAANKGIKIIIIIVIAFIATRFARSVIQRVFSLKSPLKLSERRGATLLRLINSVLTYVVSFVTILMILTEFDVNVSALIAGAGVVGLAVGFGAQNLVKDIITGFFIIFENQFSVGDFVRIGKFEGVVEEIGLRTTKIKSWTGELNILPNSSIIEVTNFSVYNSIAVVDVSIAYEENVDKAIQVIEELMLEAEQEQEDIVNVPEVLGVQTLGGSEVVIRITAEVLPMQHWAVGRYLRKKVKERLGEKNIEIPYPRIVTISKEDTE
jgi:small-conductance mechanosensitive channel